MLRSKGFTLIEIMVALFIFAIMGVLAAMSLHSMIRAHRHLKKVDKQIVSLQMTMTLLRRDISEIIDRPIRPAQDDLDPAFSTVANGIIFTRTGLFDPFHESHQSNMQRVGYLFTHHQLVRVTWNVLDQVATTKPAEQILLRHVKSLQWQLMSDDGKMFSTWPPNVVSSTTAHPQRDLPTAVLMVIRLNNADVIQGVFPIPARGNDAS